MTQIEFTDGLQNIVANLGTDRDKATHSTFAEHVVEDVQLETAYRTSWVARKVVDIPAKDAFREWREWQAENDEIEKLEQYEDRLGFKRKLPEARALARLYGESFIYLGLAGTTDPSKPIVLDRIGKDALTYLTVMPNGALAAGEMDDDVLSPTFGTPKYYTITATTKGRTLRIDPSRLIRFVGVPRPVGLAGHSYRLGDSVLQSTMEEIIRFEATCANVSSMVYEAKVDVIKVRGLMNMAGDPIQESKLIKRYALAARAKGTNGTLLIDMDDESYEQKTLDFGSLPDLMDRFGINLTGAADIPATRFFGRAPQGMSSTGEGDLRNYYDMVAAEQKLYITPALEIADEVLIRSALGSRPKEIHYRWTSLWQLGSKERADLGKTNADILKVLADMGLIPEEVLSEVAVAVMTQDGILPGLEAAYTKYFDEGGEAPWEAKDDLNPDGTPKPANEDDDDGAPPDDGGGGGGPQQFEDSQKRAPKGSPNGGQWVKSGTGGGGASSASAKAAASIATGKYTSQQVLALTEKDPKSLSHYEKKVMAKYKKALSAEGAAAAPAAAPAAPKKTFAEAVKSRGLDNVTGKAAATVAPPVDTAKAKALKSVATAQYPAEKITALMDKDPKSLSQYEKKKLHAYKKALQNEAGAPAAASSSPKVIAKSKAGQAALVAHSQAAVGPTAAHKPSLFEAAKLPPPISSTKVAQASLLASTPALSAKEATAATNYTGSSFKTMNDKLRSGGKLTGEAAVLQGAVQKHIVSTDVVLVRGLSSSALKSMGVQDINDLKVGGVLTDGGFVSTTRSLSTANSFSDGGYGMKVIVPKGRSVMPMAHLSQFKAEDEFLLPAGSKFRILGVSASKVVTVELV